MKIRITLRDKKEIETEMAKEEFEQFKLDIKKPRIKMVEIEDQLISVDQIITIQPSGEEIIPPQFRLSEPAFEKVDKTKGMEKLFNLLKSKGLFQEYRNYQKWQKEKYKD